jgi:hypothetical protein
MKSILKRFSGRHRGINASMSTRTAATPELTAAQYVEAALHHHGAGRLSEAEALCRKALAIDATHFDALHLLGVVQQQTGGSRRIAREGNRGRARELFCP